MASAHWLCLLLFTVFVANVSARKQAATYGTMYSFSVGGDGAYVGEDLVLEYPALSDMDFVTVNVVHDSPNCMATMFVSPGAYNKSHAPGVFEYSLHLAGTGEHDNILGELMPSEILTLSIVPALNGPVCEFNANVTLSAHAFVSVTEVKSFSHSLDYHSGIVISPSTDDGPSYVELFVEGTNVTSPYYIEAYWQAPQGGRHLLGSLENETSFIAGRCDIHDSDELSAGKIVLFGRSTTYEGSADPMSLELTIKRQTIAISEDLDTAFSLTQGTIVIRKLTMLNAIKVGHVHNGVVSVYFSETPVAGFECPSALVLGSVYQSSQKAFGLWQFAENLEYYAIFEVLSQEDSELPVMVHIDTSLTTHIELTRDQPTALFSANPSGNTVTLSASLSDDEYATVTIYATSQTNQKPSAIVVTGDTELVGVTSALVPVFSIYPGVQPVSFQTPEQDDFFEFDVQLELDTVSDWQADYMVTAVVEFFTIETTSLGEDVTGFITPGVCRHYLFNRPSYDREGTLKLYVAEALSDTHLYMGYSKRGIPGPYLTEVPSGTRRWAGQAQFSQPVFESLANSLLEVHTPCQFPYEDFYVSVCVDASDSADPQLRQFTLKSAIVDPVYQDVAINTWTKHSFDTCGTDAVFKLNLPETDQGAIYISTAEKSEKLIPYRLTSHWAKVSTCAGQVQSGVINPAGDITPIFFSIEEYRVRYPSGRSPSALYLHLEPLTSSDCIEPFEVMIKYVSLDPQRLTLKLDEPVTQEISIGEYNFFTFIAPPLDNFYYRAWIHTALADTNVPKPIHMVVGPFEIDSNVVDTIYTRSAVYETAFHTIAPCASTALTDTEYVASVWMENESPAKTAIYTLAVEKVEIPEFTHTHNFAVSKNRVEHAIFVHNVTQSAPVMVRATGTDRDFEFEVSISTTAFHQDETCCLHDFSAAEYRLVSTNGSAELTLPESVFASEGVTNLYVSAHVLLGDEALVERMDAVESVVLVFDAAEPEDTTYLVGDLDTNLTFTQTLTDGVVYDFAAIPSPKPEAILIESIEAASLVVSFFEVDSETEPKVQFELTASSPRFYVPLCVYEAGSTFAVRFKGTVSSQEHTIRVSFVYATDLSNQMSIDFNTTVAYNKYVFYKYTVKDASSDLAHFTATAHDSFDSFIISRSAALPPFNPDMLSCGNADYRSESYFTGSGDIALDHEEVFDDGIFYFSVTSDLPSDVNITINLKHLTTATQRMTWESEKDFTLAENQYDLLVRIAAADDSLFTRQHDLVVNLTGMSDGLEVRLYPLISQGDDFVPAYHMPVHPWTRLTEGTERFISIPSLKNFKTYAYAYAYYLNIRRIDPSQERELNITVRTHSTAFVVKQFISSQIDAHDSVLVPNAAWATSVDCSLFLWDADAGREFASPNMLRSVYPASISNRGTMVVCNDFRSYGILSTEHTVLMNSGSRVSGSSYSISAGFVPLSTKKGANASVWKTVTVSLSDTSIYEVSRPDGKYWSVLFVKNSGTAEEHTLKAYFSLTDPTTFTSSTNLTAVTTSVVVPPGTTVELNVEQLGMVRSSVSLDSLYVWLLPETFLSSVTFDASFNMYAVASSSVERTTSETKQLTVSPSRGFVVSFDTTDDYWYFSIVSCEGTMPYFTSSDSSGTSLQPVVWASEDVESYTCEYWYSPRLSQTAEPGITELSFASNREIRLTLGGTADIGRRLVYGFDFAYHTEARKSSVTVETVISYDNPFFVQKYYKETITPSKPYSYSDIVTPNATISIGILAADTMEPFSLFLQFDEFEVVTEEINFGSEFGCQAPISLSTDCREACSHAVLIGNVSETLTHPTGYIEVGTGQQDIAVHVADKSQCYIEARIVTGALQVTDSGDEDEVNTLEVSAYWQRLSPISRSPQVAFSSVEGESELHLHYRTVCDGEVVEPECQCPLGCIANLPIGETISEYEELVFFPIDDRNEDTVEVSLLTNEMTHPTGVYTKTISGRTSIASLYGSDTEFKEAASTASVVASFFIQPTYRNYSDDLVSGSTFSVDRVPHYVGYVELDRAYSGVVETHWLRSLRLPLDLDPNALVEFTVSNVRYHDDYLIPLNYPGFYRESATAPRISIGIATDNDDYWYFTDDVTHESGLLVQDWNTENSFLLSVAELRDNRRMIRITTDSSYPVAFTFRASLKAVPDTEYALSDFDSSGEYECIFVDSPYLYFTVDISSFEFANQFLRVSFDQEREYGDMNLTMYVGFDRVPTPKFFEGHFDDEPYTTLLPGDSFELHCSSYSRLYMMVSSPLEYEFGEIACFNVDIVDANSYDFTIDVSEYTSEQIHKRLYSPQFARRWLDQENDLIFKLVLPSEALDVHNLIIDIDTPDDITGFDVELFVNNLDSSDECRAINVIHSATYAPSMHLSLFGFEHITSDVFLRYPAVKAITMGVYLLDSSVSQSDSFALGPKYLYFPVWYRIPYVSPASLSLQVVTELSRGVVLLDDVSYEPFNLSDSFVTEEESYYGNYFLYDLMLMRREHSLFNRTLSTVDIVFDTDVNTLTYTYFQVDSPTIISDTGTASVHKTAVSGVLNFTISPQPEDNPQFAFLRVYKSSGHRFDECTAYLYNHNFRKGFYEFSCEETFDWPQRLNIESEVDWDMTNGAEMTLVINGIADVWFDQGDVPDLTIGEIDFNSDTDMYAVRFIPESLLTAPLRISFSNFDKAFLLDDDGLRIPATMSGSEHGQSGAFLHVSPAVLPGRKPLVVFDKSSVLSFVSGVSLEYNITVEQFGTRKVSLDVCGSYVSKISTIVTEEEALLRDNEASMRYHHWIGVTEGSSQRISSDCAEALLHLSCLTSFPPLDGNLVSGELPADLGKTLYEKCWYRKLNTWNVFPSDTMTLFSPKTQYVVSWAAAVHTTPLSIWLLVVLACVILLAAIVVFFKRGSGYIDESLEINESLLVDAV